MANEDAESKTIVTVLTGANKVSTVQGYIGDNLAAQTQDVRGTTQGVLAWDVTAVVEAALKLKWTSTERK